MEMNGWGGRGIERDEIEEMFFEFMEWGGGEILGSILWFVYGEL